jgi:hypothetical protein
MQFRIPKAQAIFVTMPEWMTSQTGRVAPVAAAAAQLLRPTMLMTGALAVWRFGVDLAVTEPFAISEGLFSRWQVWAALTALLAVADARLRRRI